jgi:hypothetical protein
VQPDTFGQRLRSHITSTLWLTRNISGQLRRDDHDGPSMATTLAIFGRNEIDIDAVGRTCGTSLTPRVLRADRVEKGGAAHPLSA